MSQQSTPETVKDEAKEIKQQQTEKSTPSPENLNQFLMEQIKELQEQLKQRDQKVDQLLEKLNPISVEDQIEQDDISSVYNNLELRTKQLYTPEEANLELHKRIKLLQESKGTYTEKLYWGEKPTDMWAAEYLVSRGYIKTLDDFNKVKAQAAKNGI